MHSVPQRITATNYTDLIHANPYSVNQFFVSSKSL